MMAGNAVVPYEAGQVALIGSNLPHNWVSDIAPGERLRQRDVVCHVRPDTIRLYAVVRKVWSTMPLSTFPRI